MTDEIPVLDQAKTVPDEGAAEQFAAMSGALGELADELRREWEGMAQVLSQMIGDAKAGTERIEAGIAGEVRLIEELKKAIVGKAGIGEASAQSVAHLAELRDKLEDISRVGADWTTHQQEAVGVLRELSEETASVAGSIEAMSQNLTARLDALLKIGTMSADATAKRDAEISKRLTEMTDAVTESGAIEKEAVTHLDSLGRQQTQIIEKLGEIAAAQKEMEQHLAGTFRQYGEKTAEAAGAVDKRLAGLERALGEMARSDKEASSRLTALIEAIGESNRQVLTFLEGEQKRREDEAEHARIAEAQRHNDRAVGLFYRGAFDAARLELTKSLELKPDCAEAYNNLGLVLSELGRPDEAVLSYRRALELEPEFAEAVNNLGLAFYTKGEYEEAVTHFQEALRRRTNYGVAYFNLGKALRQLDRDEEAVAAWKRAQQLDPGNDELRTLLAAYPQMAEEG